MGRLGNVPRNIDGLLAKWLDDAKKIIERVAPPSVPPADPTNLTVTPQPLGNQINFTMGENAQHHIIYISTTPIWNPTKPGTLIVDVGFSNHYTHHVGRSGQTYYYWVQGKHGGGDSRVVGPKQGVTLAFNAAGGVAPNIPPSTAIVHSSVTGRPVILEPRVGGGKGVQR